MAQDVNIKINVDSSNGSKGVDSLRTKIRELTEEGAKLQTQTREHHHRHLNRLRHLVS